jgi:alpha-glutamyl/putrescinyl thymine pyrophosphorylase clade 1
MSIEDLRADHPDPRRRLVYWVAERERIRIKKEGGAPRPWTDDPILRDGRFCNVRREHDRVSRWIADWLAPHADDLDLWFAIVVARFINWPPALAEIDWPLPWYPGRFAEVLQARMNLGKVTFGPAYRTPVGGEGTQKAPHLAQLLDRMWTRREGLRLRPGETLASWHARLMRCDGLGSFLAGQVIADAKYFEPARSAPDWMDFAVPGPGSERGLNRAFERPVTAKWIGAQWRAMFDKLHEAITPALDALGIKELQAQDLQNCLCEHDKFERVRLGEGKLKQRYVPHGEAKPRRTRPVITSELPFEPPSAPPAPLSTPTIINNERPMTMEQTAKILDPFENLDQLRLPQDFAAAAGVKKLITTVPVRKPDRQNFVRVHGDPDRRISAGIIELKDDREIYLVYPNVMPELVGEYHAAVLHQAITRQGVSFIWPTRLPSPDGRVNEWHRSLAEAAERAVEQWLRVAANTALGAYEIFSAIDENRLPEPAWPEISFPELLRVAFRDRIINTVDHPVIKRLRGMV